MSSSKLATRFIDVHGQPLDVALFMFAGCPFCQKVMARAEALGFALPLRDIRQDPAARAELVRVANRTTVPCLMVAGSPLFESDDIIAFIETRVRAAPGER